MPDNYFDQFEVVDPKKETAPEPEGNYFDQFEPKAPKSTALDTFARNTGEPFNRGVIGMLEFPVTLVNAAIKGGYALAGKEDAPQMRHPLTEMALEGGLIAPPEEQKHGVVARTFEFTGAGVIPAGAVLNYGKHALSELSAVPTVLSQMGRASASAPGVATAYDIAANFTAAAGGEIARQFTDNETIIAMAELGSAFVPTAAVLAAKSGPTGRMSGKVYDWALETLAPYSEAGGRVAASRRLQDVAADPKKLAADLDMDSPVPPMQQSGDEGILKLQKIILAQDPAAHAQFSKELDLAIKQLGAEATAPQGNFERAIHILNLRSQMAIEEASEALRVIGPNATARQISVAGRNAVTKALDDATLLERELWDMVDGTAPADIENAVESMSAILSKRSIDADPSEVPAWLLNKLSPQAIDESLMEGLVAAGLVDGQGVINPAAYKQLQESGAITPPAQRTLEDVKVLRGRVLQAIRDENAAQGRGINRRKLAVLNDIQAALLKDLEATGVPGVDEARAFSASLNNRFRSGRIGRLMGYDATGAEKVAGEDFLQSVIYGTPSATTTKQFVELANDAPDLALDYLRAKYLQSVVNDGTDIISQRAHNSFIKTMEQNGMFEIFPEFKAELNSLNSKSIEAMRLQVPDSQIGTKNLTPNQSRAALMLQALPGDEMLFVLKSKSPQRAIQDIMKTRAPDGKLLRNDLQAVRGLQDSFVDTVFAQSRKEVAGEMVLSGSNIKTQLEEYDLVMRALNMNDQQINRLNAVAEQIRLAQIRGASDIDIGTTITDTNVNALAKLAATVIGARGGARLSGGGGGQLAVAGFAAKEARGRLENVTKSVAERLIQESVFDRELYRSLLVGPRATTAAKDRAAAIIEREILKLESLGTTTLAIGSAQDNEDTQ